MNHPTPTRQQQPPAALTPAAQKGTMNTELATTSASDALHEKMEWSQAMSSGTLIPQQYRQNPGNLLFAAEFADNLGVGRIHVLTSIAVINGRPSASADLMAAMVRAHGHKLRVWGDDTEAHAEIVRHDDPDFTFRADWDEAKARKAGLWGNKGPWTQYPAAMLRARAISEVVRMGAQDVMAGAVYTAEELGATVNAEGEVLDAGPQNQPAQRRHEPRQEPSPVRSESPAQSAADRLGSALGATPADTKTVEEWAALVAAAQTQDELTALSRDAQKNPAWQCDIKARFTARKNELAEQEALASQVEDVDGEIVQDGDAA
ncbi:hypothetical protein PQI66_10025 [Corynebacterium sp. USCH3]|uniref:hypothetical protein n=1 Tax=Corynebacterium sp. USCH3 TaxID=3024840 RepID=UPI0030B58CBB